MSANPGREAPPGIRASSQDLRTHPHPSACPVTGMKGPRLTREGLPSWGATPQAATALTSFPKVLMV